jgi:glycosyltransferase involved in cell wall biosynthesis
MRRARHLLSSFARGASRGGRAAQPPKLLHVSIGGPILRSYFAGQLAFMRAQGFEVVLAAAGGPDLERLCRAEGARARPVAIVRSLRPWHDLKALLGLLRIMAEERPSIVHCHTSKGALLGILAAFILGVPHRIHHLRALPLGTERGPTRWLLYASELLVSRLCTETVAISDSLRQSYNRQPGLRRVPITVHGAGSGNGVDARGRFDPAGVGAERLNAFCRRIGLPAEARALCFVGRLARDKGLVELHDAWQVLRARYPDLWLILAGDLDERDPMPTALLDAWRRDPRICMPGFVEACELVFAAACINVLPSHREGFGSVLLEAAAMAIPSVASRVTGCVDAVADGATGALVPARSAPALVDAIARYLDDPELRARHGAAARRRALEQFAPERIWSGLLAGYAAALEQTRGTADAPAERVAAFFETSARAATISQWAWPMQLARRAGLLSRGANDARWQTQARAGAAEDATVYLAAEATGDRAAGAR